MDPAAKRAVVPKRSRGGDDVGQVQEGGHGGPGHKPELHRSGEPSHLGTRQAPLAAVTPDRCARGEPDRHGQEFGQGEKGQDPPPVLREAQR